MKILKTFLILSLLGMSLPASSVEIPEYSLKAAYLYNLGKFVTWPAPAFANPGSPLVIGILGEDPFGSVLEETIKDKTVQDRPLQVTRFGPFNPAQAASLRQCHILFISRSEGSRIGEILKNLNGRSVLTVSETEAFLASGGHILFFQKGEKLSLKINRKAARRSGMEIGAKLLSIFEIYE